MSKIKKKQRVNVKDLIVDLMQKHKVVPLTALHKHIQKTVFGDSEPTEDRKVAIHEMVEKCVSSLEEDMQIFVHELFSTSDGEAYHDSILVISDLRFSFQQDDVDTSDFGESGDSSEDVLSTQESLTGVSHREPAYSQIADEIRHDLLSLCTVAFGVSTHPNEDILSWHIVNTTAEVTNLIAANEPDTTKVYAMLPIQFQANISMKFPGAHDLVLGSSDLIESAEDFAGVLGDLGPDVDDVEDDEDTPTIASGVPL